MSHPAEGVHREQADLGEEVRGHAAFQSLGLGPVHGRHLISVCPTGWTLYAFISLFVIPWSLPDARAGSNLII